MDTISGKRSCGEGAYRTSAVCKPGGPTSPSRHIVLVRPHLHALGKRRNPRLDPRVLVRYLVL